MEFFKRLSGDDFFLVILGLIVVAILVQKWFKKRELVTNKASVISGDELNHFFPKLNENYHLEFSQEKAGFSLAYLLSENKIVARLSISDTNGYLKARDKYLTTEEKILTYPAVSKQLNGRSILLNNRLQINVTPITDEFTLANVEKWIKMFNLDGLSKYNEEVKQLTTETKE